jgi:4-amino-4-deoxy-L-arabinose transferase-like glycosyltransferase
VLAAVLAVVGSANLWAAALAQAALGALTAGLVYLLGRRLFDDGTGLLAGILAGLYGPAIFYTGVFLSTTLEVFLSVLILYLVTLGREQPTGLRWLGAGVVAGLGCLARPNFLLGVFALLVLLPILGPLHGRWLDWKTCWRSALAFCVGIMLIVGPNIARNRIVGGQWVVVSAAGPETFRIANSYDSTPMNFVYPKRPPMPLTSYEFWRHQARKAALFWWGFEAPQNVNYYLAREVSWVLRLPWLSFWLAIPLAAFGLWTARKKAHALAHVYVFLGIYYLSVVAFFIIARWRLPLVIPLLIFTAAGLISLYRQAIARDYKYVGASVVAIALLVTLVYPGRGPFVFAADHGQLGYILVNRGMYEDAAKHLSLAANAFPNNGVLQRDLGRVFLRLGRTGEARAALERGAALLPDDPVVHRALGRLLAELKVDTPRARAHLKRALTLAPDGAEAAEVRTLLQSLDPAREAP